MALQLAGSRRTDNFSVCVLLKESCFAGLRDGKGAYQLELGGLQKAAEHGSATSDSHIVTIRSMKSLGCSRVSDLSTDDVGPKHTRTSNSSPLWRDARVDIANIGYGKITSALITQMFCICVCNYNFW